MYYLLEIITRSVVGNPSIKEQHPILYAIGEFELNIAEFVRPLETIVIISRCLDGNDLISRIGIVGGESIIINATIEESLFFCFFEMINNQIISILIKVCSKIVFLTTYIIKANKINNKNIKKISNN